MLLSESNILGSSLSSCCCHVSGVSFEDSGDETGSVLEAFASIVLVFAASLNFMLAQEKHLAVA